jgi:hypothetical protein
MKVRECRSSSCVYCFKVLAVRHRGANAGSLQAFGGTERKMQKRPASKMPLDASKRIIPRDAGAVSASPKAKASKKPSIKPPGGSKPKKQNSAPTSSELKQKAANGTLARMETEGDGKAAPKKHKSKAAAIAGDTGDPVLTEARERLRKAAWQCGIDVVTKEDTVEVQDVAQRILQLALAVGQPASGKVKALLEGQAWEARWQAFCSVLETWANFADKVCRS